MKNFTLTLFALLFAFSISAQEKKVIRLDHVSKADFLELVKKGYDIAAFKPASFIDVVVTNEEESILKNEGFNFTTVQTEEQIKNNLIAGKTLNGYRTYNDLLTELQQIETNNPSICKLYDIGDTRGKEYANAGNANYNNYSQDIWLMKVSDNVATEEDEPSVFYFAEHHAREPISLEVNMYILNYLVSNYGTDPDVTNWIDNTQIWFVPLVNPNGHKVVIDEDDVWWRKNIRDNNENGLLDIPGGSYPDGVDPNRNYGWHFGGTGSSGSQSDQTYHGPSAFSEPEISSIKGLVDNHHFVTGITYHSYSELVLFPFGYENNATAPDHDALQELAVSMANTIPAAGGGNYTPQESWQLYPASGVTDDYTYGQNGIFTFTIELGTEFIPPANEINQMCQDNLQAALILLDRVNHSTLTGLVTDANTGLPVVAEVDIESVDNTGEFREPYNSDAGFGRYYRLLTNGNYSVTFSAYGYISQTFTSININSTGQTILNVSLVPTQTVTVTGTVTDYATGLPIENATVEALNTPLSPAQTNQNGEYTINNIMEGNYTFRVYALGYSTILQDNTVSTTNTVFDFQLQETNAWSFETGVFEPQWVFAGNAPWIITTENPYDGTYCAKSGDIADNQTSEMEITQNLSSAGDISFARKVSSEGSYDYLKFYIDGTLQDQWSGEVAWSEVNFAVSTAGIHTFKWVYYKDQGVANGSDCAWVDYIIFPPLAPIPDPAEIGINPLSFETSLPQNTSTTTQMTIANTGDLDLTFSVLKQYVSTNMSAKAYCAASGGCDEYISRVAFNTIDNSSGCDGYTDYTSITTGVTTGQTYTITVENGSVYSSDDLGVWIDWNQDKDFDDAGENVICESANGGQGTYDITVPANAFLGNTIMRIRIKYSGSDCGSPCGTTNYGEVEDYTININGNNADWLTIGQTSGIVPGSDSALINLTFNSAGMDEGVYYANVKVQSNDADQPEITVPCTFHVMNRINLQLKVLLEGAYNGFTMNSCPVVPLNQPYNIAPWNYAGTESVASIPTDVVDWVLLELRDAPDAGSANEGSRIARQAAFLFSDGSIVATDGVSNPEFDVSFSQNLFVVVRHRNHLDIISANPLILTGGIYQYDFTTEASKAYGNDPQKELVNGKFGMYGGDCDPNGIINQSDIDIRWRNDAGKSGYTPADLNLDGQSDNPDKNDILILNFGKISEIQE